MTEAFAGIDVSESGLAVAVHQSDYRFECTLDPSTSNKLIDELRRLQPALVALAGRGVAEVPLVAALDGAGLPVIVVDAYRLHRQNGKESLPADRAQQLATVAARSKAETVSADSTDRDNVNGLLERRSQLIELLTN